MRAVQSQMYGNIGVFQNTDALPSRVKIINEFGFQKESFNMETKNVVYAFSFGFIVSASMHWFSTDWVRRRPIKGTLTNGSDVTYVFPRCQQKWPDARGNWCYSPWLSDGPRTGSTSGGLGWRRRLWIGRWLVSLLDKFMQGADTEKIFPIPTTGAFVRFPHICGTI